MALDPRAVRADFPALARTVHDRPLIYLDSASTAQKPRQVIEATVFAYEQCCANVHRGVHALSVEATRAYDDAREKVRRFLGAESADEIVFTRSATEAVNLVASTFGKTVVGEGDTVLATQIEHHSNLVPWQMLCEERGADLRAIPVDDTGQLDMDRFREMLSPKVKIVAIVHVSNAIGTVLPIEEVVREAHAVGAKVVVDGAQSVAHARVDVRALGCDFFCFSGHKLFGPTGTGALYGKKELLSAMPPWQGGGDMIVSVSFERTLYADPPQRFEAGTPNIAGVIGLGAAIEYVESIGLDSVAAYERGLLEYGTEALKEVPGLRMIGTAKERAAILSFTLDRIHPHDAGSVLDGEGIAVRTGHHCAQPAMARFGVPGTVRASLALYNTREDIDALVRGLRRTVEMLS